jgi:tetratricopeptide (TPR) repeat protein
MASCLVLVALAFGLTSGESLQAGESKVESARAAAIQGISYLDSGKFSQAESSFINCLKILGASRESGDISFVPVIVHLGWLYEETGQTEKAKNLKLEVWLERVRRNDPQSKYLPALLETVGGFYALRGKSARAEKVYREDFDLLANRGMASSIDMASTLNNFGFLELRIGKPESAVSAFSRALKLWANIPGSDDLQAAMSRVGLGEAYLAMGRFGESAILFEQSLPVFEKNYGPANLRTADVLMKYAKALRKAKCTHEAALYEVRASAIRQTSAADLPSTQVINVWNLTQPGHAHFLP